MKYKIIILFSVICFSFINAKENAKVSGNSVSFEYEPKFLNKRVIDCDVQENILTKIFFVNVPEGNIKLHVGDAQWSLCEEESSRDVSEHLYESEYVYAGRQRILKIKIYPLKKMSGKTYILKKITVEIKFDKFLNYSSKNNPLLSTSINKNYLSHITVQLSEYNIPFKTYLEIKIKENGIYRIDYNDIVNAGIDPQNLSINGFTLYSDKGVVLPIDSTEFMKYVLPEKTGIKIIGDEDENFEQGEYILFFGESPHKDSTNYYDTYDLYNNPFTDYKHYMLVFNDKFPLMANNLVFTFNSDTGNIYNECIMHFDSINPLLSGYGWVWKKFNMMKDSGNIEYEYDVTLSDIIDSFGTISLSFFYQTDLNDTYDIDFYVNNKYIGNMASRGAYKYTPKVFSFQLENLKEDNSVKLVCKNTDNITKVFYLSDSRVKYKADQNNPEDILIENSNIRYLNFNPEAELFVYVKDKDNHYIGAIEENKIQSVDLLGGEKVFISKTIKKPQSLRWVDNSFIYSEKEGCDILIITGDNYKNSLFSYIQYRKKQGLNVKVYEIDEIGDGFAFGVKSPSAIKAFLSYGFSNWKKFPQYLLILGSGSYDYKNRQNNYENKNIVPVYETGYGIFEQALLSASRTQCVDRWYTLLSGNDQYIDMIPGRITVMDKNEAHYAMMKVIDYETKTQIYSKNKTMVISDDEYSSRSSSEYNDINFIYDSEDLAGLLGIYFGVKKLYLTDYWGDKQTSDHWQYDPGFKRDVRFAFKNILDEGIAFGFFYGHGSYYTLTHEHILLYPDDINLFTNIYKYPIFLFGTCQAGQFDNDFGAIAAEFQKLPYSGFSASIASTRAIGSTESINILYYSFATDLISGGHETIGEYYLTMINTRDFTSTSHVLFGDPSMKIRKYSFDIIVNSEDTLNLGSYNNFDYSTLKNNESEIAFDIYQPFYKDSHDYIHTIPYSYVYYSKSDGLLNRIITDEQNGSFSSFITDTFENKNYQSKMLITAVYEDDSLIHTGVRKPQFRYQREILDESGEIKFFIYNNEAEDSLILPSEYEFEVRFYSSAGAYLGNISGFNPAVSIKGNVDLSDLNLMYERRGEYQTNSYKVISSQSSDTIIAVIYDTALKRCQKSIVVKHNINLKTENSFILYPNPFMESFYMSFNSQASGIIKWRIIDEKGFTESFGEEVCQGGYNSLKIVPDGKLMDKKLSNGIYYFIADFQYYGKSEIKRELKKIIKK